MHMVVAQFHLALPLSVFVSFFSRAHLLSLSRPICLHRLLVSVSLHIALLSLSLPPVPQGDTFYIFSAYPYFSAVTEFLSLDHHGSLSLSQSVCVCECAALISSAWVERLHQKAGVGGVEGG